MYTPEKFVNSALGQLRFYQLRSEKVLRINRHTIAPNENKIELNDVWVCVSNHKLNEYFLTY